jgi:hypothetical protein
MKNMPLDLYDDYPPKMMKYLKNAGWNFTREAAMYAIEEMKKKNPATNKMEKLDAWSKEQVDELLKKHNITLEHNVGWNYVYVANMAKADYFKSSIPDEQHLALFVKDFIDDPDNEGGEPFRKWYATAIAKGEVIDWEEML